MHFILALLGIVSAAAFWLWRAKRGVDAGREIYDEVKGAVRRGQWSREAGERLIENLSDPREAAAVLLVQMASYDGEVTAAQKARIKNLMVVNFDCTDEAAEGFYSFGRMAIGQMNDSANTLSRLTRPIHETLTLAEMQGFIRMLETVAEIEGPPNEHQRQLIAAVRRSLSLQVNP